jgi:hypothetical protein
MFHIQSIHLSPHSNFSFNLYAKSCNHFLYLVLHPYHIYIFPLSISYRLHEFICCFLQLIFANLLRDRASCSASTLNLTIDFNVSTVHQGPHFLIFLFLPHTYFFWHFFQNCGVQLWFSLKDPILGIHSMGRGSLTLEGTYNNEKIGAKSFHYGVSCMHLREWWGLLSRLAVLPNLVNDNDRSAVKL